MMRRDAGRAVAMRRASDFAGRSGRRWRDVGEACVALGLMLTALVFWQSFTATEGVVQARTEIVAHHGANVKIRFVESRAVMPGVVRTLYEVRGHRSAGSDEGGQVWSGWHLYLGRRTVGLSRRPAGVA